MLHLMSSFNRFVVLLAAGLLLVPSVHAQPSTTSNDYDLTAEFRRADFSGTVLITDRGRVLTRRSYGLADRDFAVPVARNTRFAVASLTKLFTAVVILRLVEQARVELDAPFRRYLPDYPGQGGERITVRQLLGHMSGLPQFDTVASLDDAIANGLPQYQRLRTPRQLLELCCTAAPVARPGQRFDYNNADYIVLGQLIEAVTGESYEGALRRYVLGPLGLRDTGMMQWDRLLPRLARSYFRRPGSATFGNDLPMFRENWYAAGGLYSSVDDIVTFSNALFDGRLLTPGSMTALLTPAGDDYGLGLWSYGFSRNGIHYRVAKRPGSIMGANAMLYRLVDRGISIVILANSNAVDLDRVAQNLANAVLDGRRIR